MGDTKTFCPPFNVGSTFVSPDYFSIEKSCSNESGLEFSFSGNFTFSCGGLDNKKGIEIVKNYKSLEGARKILDPSFNNDDSETNEFHDLIKEEQSDDRDIQKNYNR